MRREDQATLALVVGFALLVVGLMAFDQHCVKTNDRDLACRAAARVVQVAAPAKY